MNKKQCVLQYTQKQTPIILEYDIIKTDTQFQEKYNLHDFATQYICQYYKQKRYIITPLGVDLRKQKVIIENELPDYFLENKLTSFCIDIKAKTSTQFFGWVNERAVLSYRELAKMCDIKVYAIFIHVIDGALVDKVGYCNVMKKPIEKTVAYDKNTVYVFRWHEGFPKEQPTMFDYIA